MEQIFNPKYSEQIHRRINYAVGACNRYARISSIHKAHKHSLSAFSGIHMVYFLCFGEEIIYIGYSSDIHERLNGHNKKDFDFIFYAVIKDEKEARFTERFCIGNIQPILNKNSKRTKILFPEQLTR